MLQYTGILQTTLELLKSLMKISSLSDFYLGGGTALSLHLGHRLSIDLDLFTQNDFIPDPIIQEIKNFHSVSEYSHQANSINMFINYPEQSDQNIKVDILKYNYPVLKSVILENGIRILAIEDIIPMKLSAIANRGAKKDFVDLYFLFKHYSLKQMLDFFSQKFPNINHFHVIKSLSYFNDAENDTDPKIFADIHWAQIKKEIIKQIKTSL